jgi:hypothetical protein
MNELTNLFWNEHFRNINRVNLKGIKGKIFDWLNRDNLSGLIVDNKVFWIELIGNPSYLPNYIRRYIISWAKNKGYKYLYSEVR